MNFRRNQWYYSIPKDRSRFPGLRHFYEYYRQLLVEKVKDQELGLATYLDTILHHTGFAFARWINRHHPKLVNIIGQQVGEGVFQVVYRVPVAPGPFERPLFLLFHNVSQNGTSAVNFWSLPGHVQTPKVIGLGCDASGGSRGVELVSDQNWAVGHQRFTCTVDIQGTNPAIRGPLNSNPQITLASGLKNATQSYQFLTLILGPAIFRIKNFLFAQLMCQKNLCYSTLISKLVIMEYFFKHTDIPITYYFELLHQKLQFW